MRHSTAFEKIQVAGTTRRCQEGWEAVAAGAPGHAAGAHETDSADLASMLMFEPRYLELLISLGERDITARLDDLRVILGHPKPVAVAAM